MRCRTLAALLLAVLLSIPVPAGAADSAEDAVLVVCPQQAHRAGVEDDRSALAGALLSLRCRAEWTEAPLTAGELAGYERVIWCDTGESAPLDAEALEGYTGSVLILGRSAALERLGLARETVQRDVVTMGAASYTCPDGTAVRASVPVRCPGAIEEPEAAAGTLELKGRSLPLVSVKGNVRYIALGGYTGIFARAVLTQELAQWLPSGTGQVHTYAEYIVLDEVYPFTDLGRLRRAVEVLTENRLPYVLSVMPLYRHEDYPAMDRFCDVLRYAQANGGAVMLHAPIVQNGVEAEELTERVSTAMQCYLSQDVYPLAMEIPSGWLFRPDLLPLLRGVRTLFFSDMDSFARASASELNLDAYLDLNTQQIVPALALDETGVSHITCCPTALYLNLSELEDWELEAAVEAVKQSPVPLQSLWDMEANVSPNETLSLRWNRAALLVNGVQRDRGYQPLPEAERFDYHRDVYYRIVANLNRQNHLFMGISAVALALFLLLLVRSRRQMHSRFLKRTNQDRTERE